ncbi:MAG TPA: hypothetical protein VG184_07095 [Acidimicrobiales bacterium]|jgi:uncharacterized protein YkwD|nr:hypothetical protein [Acidimicrobiales bacterium]
MAAGAVTALIATALVAAAAFGGAGTGRTLVKTSVAGATKLSAVNRSTPSTLEPTPVASAPAVPSTTLPPAKIILPRPIVAARVPSSPAKAAVPTPRRPAVFTSTKSAPRLPLTAPPPTSRPPVQTPAATPAPAPASPANPAGSLAPSQSLDLACYTDSVDVSSCDSAALGAINQARAGEGLGPMQLPGDFYSLDPQAQVIAVSNAERASRGLSAMAENPVLDALAQVGAVVGGDPTGPLGFAWASIYSIGEPTALAADYTWMYDDGPASPNLDCPAVGSAGCWGHRDNILSPWPGQAGAGVSYLGGRETLAAVFVENF